MMVENLDFFINYIRTLGNLICGRWFGKVEEKYLIIFFLKMNNIFIIVYLILVIMKYLLYFLFKFILFCFVIDMFY